MEKELKIAELASIWGVSVPTTWNRIKKNELKTFIKKDENNKEVNYVSISEEKINEYIIKVKNNGNNGHYEDILNVDNDDNNVIDAEYIKQDKADRLNIISDVFNGLKEVYYNHNEELKILNKALQDAYKTHIQEITEKDKQILLLEDFKNRNNQDIIELQGTIKMLEAQKKRYILSIILLVVTFFAIIITMTVFLTRAYY